LIFGAQGFLAAWSRSDRLTWLAPAVHAIPWIVLGVLLVAVWRRGLRWVNPSFPGVSSRRARWVGFSVVIVGVLVWKYTTVSPRSWAFLLPTEWTWPVPTSLYWRGFAAEHWWPIGAGEFAQGVIFTPLAIVMASIFVTFPFVARSLIPLMEAQGVEAEQAAISLGAGGWYTFRRVTLPSIKWGLLYGVVLCSARAFGEFGAISVVAGGRDANDTMPLRVEKLWQEYKTQAAFTVASLLAMLAVVTLILKTIIEWRTRQEVQDENSGPKTVLGGARH
jgi:ABC-type sugar transport system permease subunit